MNPYNRFSLFSSSVTAALVLAILAFSGPSLVKYAAEFEGSARDIGLTVIGIVTVLVVFWMAFTEVILPSLFRLNWVRKMILGRYYVEGTWLQAEKGVDGAHIAVIDIQPNGKAFTFSGYALDENLDVNSNVLLELSRFDWPFLTFKYRNSLSDGSDGQRDGVGEVQFEMNREAARRYNGYSQYIKNDRRVRLEGTKLTRNSDVKRLRTLNGREEIVDKYWDLFFGRQERRMQKARELRPVAAVNEAARQAAEIAPEPIIDEAVREEVFAETREMPVQARQVEMPEPPAPAEEAPFDLTEQVIPADDRRTGEAERPAEFEEHVIPRRRAADWQKEEASSEDAGDDIQSAEAEDQNVPATAESASPKAADRAEDGKAGAKQARPKGVYDARHVM